MAQKSSDRRRQAELERARKAVRQTRVLARDAGLDLIGRTTRWLVVGATGAISLYASHAFRPHHPAAVPTLSSPASSPTSISPSPAQTGASGLGPAPNGPLAKGSAKRAGTPAIAVATGDGTAAASGQAATSIAGTAGGTVTAAAGG